AASRNPAVAARSVLGRLPYAPSARERGRSRRSGGPTGASAGGGLTTSDSNTAWVSTLSLTLAALTTAPRGMPQASLATPIALPHLRRSTGDGPVSSPPFLTASWSRRGGPDPS